MERRRFTETPYNCHHTHGNIHLIESNRVSNELPRLPKDGFFFLGDNSAHSYDSRHWGSVPGKNIYGKVARIYYPLSRIGVPR